MLQAAMHWLGFGLCHQLPERSFFGGGVQLPVCARDTGIYFGFVISLALIAALDRRRHRSGMTPWWVLALGGVFLAVMAWDGVTSYAGLRPTTNEIRLVTGLLAGFSLPLVVAPLVNSQLWRRSSPERVLERAWEVALWAAAIPVSFAALWWGAPWTGVAYPLLAAAAILVTFTAVNLVMVLLAPRFEQRAERLFDAWLPLLIALGLTFAEIAVTGWLRAALLSLAGSG
jgi:uncharacterized membrane protein